MLVLFCLLVVLILYKFMVVVFLVVLELFFSIFNDIFFIRIRNMISVLGKNLIFGNMIIMRLVIVFLYFSNVFE